MTGGRVALRSRGAAVLVLGVTVSCGSDQGAAVSVAGQGQVVEVERAVIDDLTGLLMDQTVARSILFEDESEEHVRAVVTEALVLDAIGEVLLPDEVVAEDLDDRRSLQVRALHGELIYYNELDPAGRAAEMAESLRPYLDVVATNYLKQQEIEGFEAAAQEFEVDLDAELGEWDPQRLRVRE